MFSFLGKLFGTDKAGEAIVDGAISVIDKIWYTEEEKAEDRAQAKREAAAVYMKWLESTSGSRLARRMIAFIITAPWGTAMTLSWIMDAIAPFFSGAVEVRRRVGDEIITEIVLRSEQFTQAADSLAANASENNTLVGVVLLFYFGGPAAVDASKGLVQKWVGKSK